MKSYSGVAAFEDALKWTEDQDGERVPPEVELEHALGWAPDGAYYFVGVVRGTDDRIIKVVP